MNMDNIKLLKKKKEQKTLIQAVIIYSKVGPVV